MVIVNPYAKRASASAGSTNKAPHPSKNETQPTQPTTTSAVHKPTMQQQTKTPAPKKSAPPNAVTNVKGTNRKQQLKLELAAIKQQHQQQQAKIALLKEQKKVRKRLKKKQQAGLQQQAPSHPQASQDSNTSHAAVLSQPKSLPTTTGTTITTTKEPSHNSNSTTNNKNDCVSDPLTTSEPTVEQTSKPPSQTNNNSPPQQKQQQEATPSMDASSPYMKLPASSPISSTQPTKPAASPDSLVLEPIPLNAPLAMMAPHNTSTNMDYLGFPATVQLQPMHLPWQSAPSPFPLMMAQHNNLYANLMSQQQQQLQHPLWFPNQGPYDYGTNLPYSQQQPQQGYYLPNPAPPVSAPPQPAPPQKQTISASPCQPGSPYSMTHYLVASPVRLVKPDGGSFGITMTLDSKSNTTNGMRFSVLKVLDPAKQNSRHLEPVLQPQDLILSVNGISTSGKIFSEACALFQQSKLATECVVTIARKRPAVKPPLPVEHYGTLASGVLEALQDPARLLGSARSNKLLRNVLSVAQPKVTPFEYETVLKTRLAHWQQVMDGAANAYWSVRPLTDVRLSELRHRPHHNPKQCRCGSKEHLRVNHPDCPLYQELRLLDSASATSTHSTKEQLDWTQVKKVLDQRTDLKVVEKAYLDKQIRQESEKEADEEELRFVARMTKLQLTQQNQAIRAPSLTAMVLSAVVDLEKQLRDAKLEPLQDKAVPKAAPAKPEEDDSDDDDDDVPLTALGSKRKEAASTTDDSTTKKSRRVTLVRNMYWAKLFHYVSSKWGHVYREPSDEEHAWRWEVFHGQLSESGSKWDVTSGANPRRAGKYSLANVRFLLDDSVAAQLVGATDSSEQQVAMEKLAFACSPATTGVCDELLALIRTLVVEIDGRGIPVLSQDWWTKIDFLLLDEMRDVWGRVVDRIGKHGVSEPIRTQLEDTWKNTEFGWALAENEDDIIYDAREFSEWWNAFCEQRQSASNAQDGIGRFS